MDTPSIRSRPRIVVTILLTGLLILAVTAAIFLYPEPFFAHQVSSGNLTLYSDTPFTNEDGVTLLRDAENRLNTSPLYDRSRHYRIFICNGCWRRKFFFLPAPSSRGVSYLCSTAVFLCDGNIRQNCICRSDGTPNTNGPNLAYYTAHEIIHVCTEAKTNPLDYLLLPNWIREGYADYVARGSLLNDPTMREAFLRNSPEMNYPAIAPYLRYNLLVAHYLETESLTPEQLFDAAPEQKEAEVELLHGIENHQKL